MRVGLLKGFFNGATMVVWLPVFLFTLSELIHLIIRSWTFLIVFAQIHFMANEIKVAPI